MNRSKLARLFPDCAVVLETDAAGDPLSLYPVEAQAVARAVPARAQEFAAGRACARNALSAIGMDPVALPVRADRRPVWPAGVRGSISHTPGLCVAVVAPASRVAAVGIDVERLDRLRENLWPQVLTSRELAFLHRQPGHLKTSAATLMFSAKEAFFKCQFELTSRGLEFLDVEIDIDDGQFRVLVLSDPAAPNPIRYRGRFEYRPLFVCTGCYVEVAVDR